MHRHGDQPGRALSPSQDGGNSADPNLAPLQDPVGLMLKYGEVWRDIQLWVGQNGLETGESWERTLLRGDGEERVGEGMGCCGL